jgi:hypothetical protein
MGKKMRVRRGRQPEKIIMGFRSPVSITQCERLENKEAGEISHFFAGECFDLCQAASRTPRRIPKESKGVKEKNKAQRKAIQHDLKK